MTEDELLLMPAGTVLTAPGMVFYRGSSIDGWTLSRAWASAGGLVGSVYSSRETAGLSVRVVEGVLGAGDLDRLPVGSWVNGVALEGITGYFAIKKSDKRRKHSYWVDGSDTEVDPVGVASHGVLLGSGVQGTFEVTGVLANGGGAPSLVVHGIDGIMSGIDMVVEVKDVGNSWNRVHSVGSLGSTVPS